MILLRSKPSEYTGPSIWPCLRLYTKMAKASKDNSYHLVAISATHPGSYFGSTWPGYNSTFNTVCTQSPLTPSPQKTQIPTTFFMVQSKEMWQSQIILRFWSNGRGFLRFSLHLRGGFNNCNSLSCVGQSKCYKISPWWHWQFWCQWVPSMIMYQAAPQNLENVDLSLKSPRSV